MWNITNDTGWQWLDEAAANDFDEKAKGMSSTLYHRFSSRAELGYRIAISVARHEYPGDPTMSEINIHAIAKRHLILCISHCQRLAVLSVLTQPMLT